MIDLWVRKMKKIFEKLKHKIIRKLGGYVVDPNEECVVHVSQRRLITMCSKEIVPTSILNNVKLCAYHENEAAIRLAENLLAEGLIEFRRDKCDSYDGDPRFGTTKLTAIITVAEPVNYEVNYFLGEEDDG